MPFFLVQSHFDAYLRDYIEMDPLPTLTVASAVVQMVYFGSKVFFKSVELCQSAEDFLPTNVEFSVIGEDLSQIRAGFATANGLKQEQRTKDEVALNISASRCYSLANELITDLQRLVV